MTNLIEVFETYKASSNSRLLQALQQEKPLWLAYEAGRKDAFQSIINTLMRQKTLSNSTAQQEAAEQQ